MDKLEVVSCDHCYCRIETASDGLRHKVCCNCRNKQAIYPPGYVKETK